jgi:hypothetical protein
MSPLNLVLFTLQNTFNGGNAVTGAADSTFCIAV